MLIFVQGFFVWIFSFGNQDKDLYSNVLKLLSFKDKAEGEQNDLSGNIISCRLL